MPLDEGDAVTVDGLAEVVEAVVGLESVAARATAATDTVPSTLAVAAAQVNAAARR